MNTHILRMNLTQTTYRFVANAIKTRYEEETNQNNDDEKLKNKNECEEEEKDGTNIQSLTNTSTIKRNNNSWSCYNCDNINFTATVTGKRQLSNICKLCGNPETDSIIYMLKQKDTPWNTSNEMNMNIEDNEIKVDDDIDKQIQKVITAKKFDVSCPNKSNKPSTTQCRAIINVARVLLSCNRWLKDVKKGEDDFYKIDINDVAEIIDDETFKKILIQSINSCKHKKFTDNLKEEFVDIITNNIKDVLIVDKFDEKEFKSLIKEITNNEIKPFFATRVYKPTMKELKKETQKQKYGEFLYNLNIGQLQEDFHHIKHCHVDCGDKNTMQNVFTVFETTIHCGDCAEDIELIDSTVDYFETHNSKKEIKHCRSLQWRDDDRRQKGRGYSA